MSSTTLGPRAVAVPARAPWAARSLLRVLERLCHGTLELHLPDGGMARLGAGAPHASLRLHDWSVCADVLRHGDIGLGESYLDGRWSTPDLAGLLRLLAANRDALEQAVYGQRWAAWLHRWRHLARRNTRSGSRRNIRAHYDLGNEFYALWLDDTLSYSAACFDGDERRSLADAQRAKMDRALDACGIEPGQRLLEIGCGWGGLAARAAERGARVTGVTLSPAQLAQAQQRLTERGLAPRTELRLQDYRDLAETPFDALVSIEMFEAVGIEYWPAWFATVSRQLRRGGRACVQTIVIRDDLFDRYRRGTDFIQQHVFPGGLLPSASRFREQAQRAGLRVVDEHAFGADYALTLQHWRERFTAAEAAVRALGHDERFLRTWHFYLAYCEAAFAGGSTDVVQFTLQHA